MSGSLCMAQFIKLFFFVLFLCSTLCLSVYASSSAQLKTTTSVLVESIKIQKNVFKPIVGNVEGGITLKEIKLPFFLVAVKGGVILVVTEAKYTGNGASEQSEKYDLVTRCFELAEQSNWEKEIFKDVDTEGKTQLVTENNGGEKAFSTIMASTVNVDSSKAYVFLLNITSDDGNQKYDFKLVVGTVGDEEANKKITWKKKEMTLLQTEERIKEKLNEHKLDLSLANGFIFLTEEKKIVFVMRSKLQDVSSGTSANKNVNIFFLFEEKDNELNLLHVECFMGWYSFFQLDGKIFKTSIDDPNDDKKNVMVFDVTQEKFTEINSSITHFQDFLKNKNNFVNAKIKENSVLLFTQLRPNATKNDVYLFITDGTRIGSGGIITTYENTKTFYGSVLHSDNKLFALYQKYQAGEANLEERKKIYFTLLKEQLVNITSVLNFWKESDKRIKELCKNTVNTVIPCSTDRLVSFLSNKSNGNEWIDEYEYVNATVTQGAQVENGFKFEKPGAGAQWILDKKRKPAVQFC